MSCQIRLKLQGHNSQSNLNKKASCYPHPLTRPTYYTLLQHLLNPQQDLFLNFSEVWDRSTENIWLEIDL